LFRSFKIVKQKIPEAHLLVIGDGPLRRQLEELVKDLGLADSVSFLGHISHDHVQELLGKTEVVVMPSIGEGEGLPYAVLEAMSHAKPVVATSVGGLPELVIDGETGIIVSPLDCVQLAEAIITLMQNPTLAHEMGKKGRKRVESEFSYNAMIDQTERLLLDVLNK
jgi:glycosyltransferase involved in cell wall biosynthesis